MDCVICRYGEIALKGRNRGVFEKRLLLNIKDCLRKNSIVADVKKVRGRLFVYTADRNAQECIRRVFGLTSISPAVICENLPETILQKVIGYVDDNINKQKVNTFRITTRRTNKSFPKTSNETDIMLGDAVNERFGFKVKLKDPDLNIGVEVHEKTFIFHDIIPCFGGLPIGVSGSVACLIEDKNSIAAAWRMMKRGCVVFPTGIEKKDIGLLERFAYGFDISFEKLESIADIPTFMETNDCKALVTGDTLESFNPETYNSLKTTILCPLIAYGEKEVSELLEAAR